MKLSKWIASLVALTLVVGAHAAEKLVVGATPEPHAKLLEFVKPELAKQGVDLQIRVFTDYIQPNRQLSEGGLDANFFQHGPYLNTYNDRNGTNIIPVGNVHVEPLAAYSQKYKTIADLPKGAIVAIPNDPSNGGRALLLLQANGLISLKNPTDLLATVRDVVFNPKKLQFQALDAASLPRVLPDVDMAVINSNYALQAGLNSTKDALIIEGADSPYVNFIATVPAKKADPRIKKLVAALQTKAVADYIRQTFHGAVVPVAGK